jgi:hypothetical protein
MMCLGVVVGAVAWKMWPLNEQELFEKIAENYSNDPTWTDVDRILKDIDTYQTKFEDGPHKDEISGFKDQIEMDRAESRALARVESNDPDLTEAEAKYVEAKEFEDFGDRLTAVEHYEGVVNLFEGIEKDRAIVNLAKARIKDLQAAPAADGSLNTVNAALQRAETAFRHRGARLKARGIWQSVVRRTNRKFLRFRCSLHQQMTRATPRPTPVPARRLARASQIRLTRLLACDTGFMQLTSEQNGPEA